MRAASLLLTPRYALVDRDVYARRVDRELVVGMSSFASRPESERLACLDLILARSAEFSGFHSTSPLMSATPEGRVKIHMRALAKSVSEILTGLGHTNVSVQWALDGTVNVHCDGGTIAIPPPRLHETTRPAN